MRVIAVYQPMIKGPKGTCNSEYYCMSQAAPFLHFRYIFYLNKRRSHCFTYILTASPFHSPSLSLCPFLTCFIITLGHGTSTSPYRKQFHYNTRPNGASNIIAHPSVHRGQSVEFVYQSNPPPPPPLPTEINQSKPAVGSVNSLLEI